jgi:ribosomal protein S6
MQQNVMKPYEVSFLVKNENGAASLIRELHHFGGEITNEGEINPVSTSYPTSAGDSVYFGFVHCNLPVNSIRDIKNSLKLNKDVIKSLIINPPFGRPKAERAVRQSRDTSAGRKETRSLSSKSVKPQPSNALSNELLEEKLEEILS